MANKGWPCRWARSSTEANFDASGTAYTVLPMPTVNGKSQTSSFVNTWVIP